MPEIDTGYYEQVKVWGKEAEFYQIQVLADITSLIPDDVTSILDVGCGDGLITNNLPDKYNVHALDISLEALKHVRTENKHVGSVLNMPFDDNFFDVVMINDVLEHISDEYVGQAYQELTRVASKLLIVTVPLNEPFQLNFTQCKGCQLRYHINNHKRRYSEFSMAKELAPYGEVVEIRLSGGVGVHSMNELESVIADAKINQHWEGAMCPACSSTEQSESTGIDTYITLLESEVSKQVSKKTSVGSIWNDRSEVITVLDVSENRCLDKPRYDEGEKYKSKLSKLDFLNPFIVVNEFVPARFLPQALVKKNKIVGGMLINDSSETERFEFRFPAIGLGGDRIKVTFSTEDVNNKVPNVYVQDGLSKTEMRCLPDGGLRDKADSLVALEYCLPGPVRPDKFGLAVEIYLPPNVRLFDVQYCGTGFEIDFFNLKKGHNVFPVSFYNGVVPITWGMLADRACGYPVLAEDNLFEVLQPSKKYVKTKEYLESISKALVEAEATVAEIELELIADDMDFTLSPVVRLKQKVNSLNDLANNLEVTRANLEKIIEDNEINSQEISAKLTKEIGLLNDQVEQMTMELNRYGTFGGLFVEVIRKIKSSLR